MQLCRYEKILALLSLFPVYDYLGLCFLFNKQILSVHLPDKNKLFQCLGPYMELHVYKLCCYEEVSISFIGSSAVSSQLGHYSMQK